MASFDGARYRLYWRMQRYRLALGLVVSAGCGGTPETMPDAGAQPVWKAEHIGPHSGFVSAVAFVPGSGTSAWISGDDASGIYRTDDGGNTLVPVTSAPLDWSTWSFVFGDGGQRVIAPAYYGRGVAISTDGGATWHVATDGLPQSGSADARHIWDAVITPANEVLLATGSGLYRSADGEHYSRVDSSALATATALTRIIRTSTGYVLGSENGRIYRSANAVTWTEDSTSDGPAITDFAEGAQGVYVAMQGGTLIRFSPSGQTTTVIDSTIDRRFELADTMKLAIAPIGAKDRIYVGVSVAVASTRRSATKLFVSDNGGATFTASSGLGGSSIFQLAVDPTNPSHALAGTVGDGVYVTTNAGAQWKPVEGDLRTTAVIGFAQDPADPSHIALTSVDTGPGTPSLWERVGGLWTQQPALLEDGNALLFDGGALFAGGGGTTASVPAIRRSANGGTGPFATEVQTSEQVMRLVRTARGIYAAGDGLRRRNADGTWAVLRPASPGENFRFNDVAEAADGSIVTCGAAGISVSATGDFSDAVALAAPDRTWYSCAISPAGRIVATSFGPGASELWTAPDLSAARSAGSWSQLATPIDHSTVASIVIAGDYWMIGGGDLLDGATVQSRSGIYASSDSGATWQAIDSDIWPSRIAWRLHRGSSDSEVYVPMWGGGLWRLTRGTSAGT